MSVTQTTEPEVGSDAALAALFADAPLPAPSAETPSPAPPKAATEAPEGTARAERATAPTGTDADAPPAESAEVAPAEPEPAAAPARTTHPKSWKGSEDEWQAFRAEQNRAANRERDRAADLEKQLAERADRETFLTAQTLERDRAYRELLVSIAQERQIADPERFAQDYLDASITKGNQQYGTARQERESAEADSQRVEAEASRSQVTAEAEAEAIRRATYMEHYSAVGTYAIDNGVAGLDIHALYGAAFAEPETADDIEESRRPDITDERRQRLVARVYKRADQYVQGKVDAAAAAKAAAATDTRPDTSAGRKTAVGGTAAGTGGPVQDYSAEAFDREMTAYYAAQDAQRPRVAKPMLR